jgi:hypothetical protein
MPGCRALVVNYIREERSEEINETACSSKEQEQSNLLSFNI